MFKKFLRKLIKEEKPYFGCFDEQDERTFGAEVIGGQVEKSDLTDKDFKTCDFPDLIFQDWTDFCVGCSAAYSKQATENKGMMSWPGAYALACKYIGYIPEFGMGIITMMKARCAYGIPEYYLYPFDTKKTKVQLANWNNIPPMAIKNALEHRDKSFFIINVLPGWSKFDAFRAYLNKFKDDKVTINTGINNHAVTLCEQKTINGELRIGGPDSYGQHGLKYPIGITINGWRYFNKKEVVNFFGGYIGTDMSRTLAELLVAYTGKAIKVENDSKCWLVKDGKRRYIRNEAIAWANNTLLYDDNFVIVVKEEELNSIPVGNPLTYTEGQNYPIVQRVLEKAATMTPEGIKKLLEDLKK